MFWSVGVMELGLSGGGVSGAGDVDDTGTNRGGGGGGGGESVAI
jgi:hypothetical protein